MKFLLSLFAATALYYAGAATITAEMLERAYHHDMQSKDGRAKWHGSIVSNVFDSATMVVKEYHEDGYVYERKGAKASRPLSPEEIAERKAKRTAELAKRMPKQAAEAVVKRETDTPTTNTVNVVVKPEEAQ